VIRKLMKSGWETSTLINVNFPDVAASAVTGIEVVQQGKRDLTDLLLDARVDARGVPYYWIGFRRQKNKSKRHTDLGAIENGAISVTPLQLDLTHEAGMRALKSALA
jgi:5'-nucleotidase